MKKENSLILLLLIVIIIAPLISAVDIQLSKDNYNPLETLQAEITGNFLSLSLDNILIYEENTPRSQPVISDLTKQGNTYHFYAVLPNQQGNYSLKIEDARYTESGQTKTDTITKEFKIKTTNQSVLQINPGFVLTSEDFSIKVKAINLNQEIKTTFNGISQNLSLIEDVQKNIEFSVSDLVGKYDLKINTYTIPVFIIEKIIIEEIINKTDIINKTNIINKSINISDLSKTEIKDYIEELGETESLSCYDIGRVCLVNQECEGETVASLEGSCCIGECVEEEEGNSTGMIIGIILLAIVIVVVGFLILKAKKQKPKSTDEILKSKEKQFQQRMKDQASEVTGSLGKV